MFSSFFKILKMKFSITPTLHFSITPIFILCVLCGEALSQDYVSDTLAVRAILDSNGLDTISIHFFMNSKERGLL